MTKSLLSFKLLFSFIMLITANNSSYSQNGLSDPTFNPGDNGLAIGDGPDNYMRTSCIQSNGKILIGGNFSNYNSVYNNHIARLNSDGTLDNTFITGSGAWSIVHAIAVQTDGRIIIAGDFTTYNGTSVNRIARLNSNGSIDAGFFIGTGANGTINSIFIQPDGKIVIGGSFTTYNGVARNKIARINPTGTLDGTFVVGSGITGVASYVSNVKLQPDGKVLVGGYFSAYNGTARNNIVRLNSTGAVDTSFDPLSGASAQVVGIGIQTDGKIILGGAFTGYAGNASNYVCRINSDGSYDAGFNIGVGFNAQINSIDIQNDGKVLVAGNFSTFDGASRNKIVRLNADGSLDSPFANDLNASGNIYSIVLQSDGKVLVGGSYWEFNTYTVNSYNRLNSNGTLDLTFNPSTAANGIVLSTAIQPDGKIIVGGEFTGYFWTTHRKLIRINPDGTIDPTFNIGGLGVNGNGKIEEVKLLPDGKILVAGNFSSYNGIPISGIARINPDGSLDPTFNPGTSTGGNTIYDLIILGSGKYMIGGTFTTYNGTAIRDVARLNTDGTLDLSFNTGTGSNWAVRTVVEQVDGKVIVGGYFGTWNGATWNRLVRLNTDGSIDNTFNIGTGANNVVWETALQTDGKILIGGQFTTFNGVARNQIARLNSDGSLDTSFDPGVGPNSLVAVIKQQSNEKLLIGGNFTSINGTTIKGIARLYSNGTLDNSFGAINSVGQNERVGSIEQQSDENLIISGEFTSYNGIGRNRIARITNCVTPIGTDVQTACEPYTWIDGNTYTTSNNTAFHTVMSTSNCDSLVYLNLTMFSPTYATQSASACSSYTWPLNGETYNVSGNYVDTLINSVGCDSIVTLTLSINDSFATQIETVCDTYIWPINNTTYSISGLYIDTIPNFLGCDSIITLDLTILNSTFGIDVQTACDSLIWIDGLTYYSNNNSASFVIPNSVGCDSTITLDLTVLQSSLGTDIQSACDSYTWIDGNTYFSSTNSATFIVSNSIGCDSIITLDLTIFNSTYYTDVHEVCNSLVWIDGNTYTSNNTSANYILPNAAGCDSIITLHLTILTSDAIEYSCFVSPAQSGICNGELTLDFNGISFYDVDIDNGSILLSGTNNVSISSLCPGIHSIEITDICGNLVLSNFVVPIDTNYIINNGFPDSLTIDSLSTNLEVCAFDFNSINTAYIDSLWVNGNTAYIIWNIVNSTEVFIDTVSYILNNGDGVYLLQLSIYCPLNDYFTVTEAIYFGNGTISLANISSLELFEFAVYPNPTFDYVKIEFSDTQGQLSIFDLQGKLISITDILNEQLISLKNLHSGIYLFELACSSGKTIKRVIKN